MSCTFPVTENSPPECILLAFKQSGYFDLLNEQQKEAATRDPVGWLKIHPYLYSAYPNYFRKVPEPTSPPVNPGGNINIPWGQIGTSIPLMLNPVTAPFGMASIMSNLLNAQPANYTPQYLQSSQAVNPTPSLGAEFKAISDAIVGFIQGLAKTPGIALQSLFEAGAAFERAPWGSLFVIGLIAIVLILFILR